MPYLSLLILVLWAAALIDVIVADEHRVRHLPKMVWLIIVILVPLVGSIIWFLVGRPEGRAASVPPRATGFPEHQRPENPEYRAAVEARENADFQRQVRERAEAQRRKGAGPDSQTPDVPPRED